MKKSRISLMHYLLGIYATSIAKTKKDPLEGIDIEKEYKLIQQKKSSLSANMRRLVVERYESNKNKSK